MKNYRKLYAAVGGFFTVLGQVLADGSIDGTELGLLATAAAVVFGVWRLKNDPQGDIK